MPGQTSFLAVEDLDAAETLAAAAEVVRDRRALEVRELELVLHWADLHSHDPGEQAPGGVRMVQLGGVGTPMVQALPLHELAQSRGQHVFATRAFLADALDLRHRLPGFYDAVRVGLVDLWAARR